MVDRMFVKPLIGLFFLFVLLPIISAQCESGQVDINTASLEELDQLYGIGPVKAQAIIDYRENNSFDSVDELIEVNGIGEATLTRIKEDGLACVESDINEENNQEEEILGGENSGEETSREDNNDGETYKPKEIINYTSDTENDSLIENNSISELQPIKLNYPATAENPGKDIKSGENSEILSKDKIAMYGFFVFSIVIAALLIIRRKKIYQNDFR